MQAIFFFISHYELLSQNFPFIILSRIPINYAGLLQQNFFLTCKNTINAPVITKLIAATTLAVFTCPFANNVCIRFLCLFKSFSICNSSSKEASSFSNISIHTYFSILTAPTFPHLSSHYIPVSSAYEDDSIYYLLH